MKKDVENKLAPEILQRKSVSHWNGKKCSEEIWDLLIEAARLAPSSWNHQPARYIIVKDEKNIRALSQCLHRTNQWVSDASGLIVQVANPEDDDCMDGKDYYLYDCGLAMMSLIYQAQIMGLTCRQMIGWDEQQVKQRLGIPAPYRVVVITALGFPSRSVFRSTVQDLKRNLTQQNRRYKANQVFFWEKWNGKTSHESYCEYAPSFLLSPSTRRKVQHVRLYTDIIGLLIVYTFGQWFPASVQWIISIYTIFAWVTILTIDPSRLPNAAATRQNQRESWIYFFRYILLIGIVFSIVWHLDKFHALGVPTIGSAVQLIILACMIELFYRNILQVKLRQFGFPVYLSVTIQSFFFSVSFYISSHSLVIALGAFIIGLINGHIVYKTRSIYPNFIITIVWLVFFPLYS